jgi:hypothetical protein
MRPMLSYSSRSRTFNYFRYYEGVSISQSAPPVLFAAIKTDACVYCLAEFLVLRVMLRGVTGHSALGHARVLVCGLLCCLEILLVVQRGFGGHVCSGHSSVLRHPRLAGRYLRVAVLGRVDLVLAVDAVAIVARWLGRVQTGLRIVSKVRGAPMVMRVPG